MMVQVIRELVIYIAFVVVWLLLLTWRRNVQDANLMSSAARTAFIDERFGDFAEKTYTDVGTTDDLFAWINGPLYGALFTEEDYNGDPLPKKERNRVLNNGIPVGKLEFKQYRVRNDSCGLQSTQRNTRVNMTSMYYIPECYGFYSSSTRDTMNFGPAKGNDSRVDDNSGFTFHFKEPGQFSVSISGNYGSYPSVEAFIRELEFGDNEVFKTALSDLETQNWIDRATRAIVISILIYYPSYDSFVASQFLIEIPPSGLLYPKSKLRVSD